MPMASITTHRKCVFTFFCIPIFLSIENSIYCQPFKVASPKHQFFLNKKTNAPMLVDIDLHHFSSAFPLEVENASPLSNIAANTKKSLPPESLAPDLTFS